MQRTILSGVIGLVTLGSGLGFGQVQTLTSGTPGATVLERILVKVNGGLITQTDLEEAQVNALLLDHLGNHWNSLHFRRPALMGDSARQRHPGGQ